MIAAQIRNGVVLNVIVLPDDFVGSQWDGHPVVLNPPRWVAPWDNYNAATATFTKGTPPPRVPTRREELQARAETGTITAAEIREALSFLLKRSND